MIVGLFTDAHFSVSSSILNILSGYQYSARLDMLVNSFKWMYKVFDDYKVELIFNAGDLFDSDLIKAREASALSEALSYGGRVPEYYVLGNHEKDDKLGKFSSLSLLDHNREITVVSEPTKINSIFSVLPYTDNFDSIDFESLSNKILISHVAYEGMNLGGVSLSYGVDMMYASSYFDLILNGHIHSPSVYCDSKIVNIGSIVGHSFDDNYSVCYPSIMILDTDTCKFRRIINPYSAVFLRACASSIADLNKYLKGLSNLNNPKCLKVEVPYELRDEAQQFINSVKDRYNIVAVRITSKLNKSTILANMHSEDIELLHGFESGSAAMAQYVNSQDDNTLPAPKSKVMDFINKYLS